MRVFGHEEQNVMLKRLVRSLAFAAATLLLAQAASLACGGPDCAASLAYEAFGGSPGKPPRALAVFLHGSVSAGGPADYMYGTARRFAEGHKDVVAIALLAPGYYDRNGKRSDGSDAGRRLSDDSDAVIDALEALRAKYKPRRLVVLGHSKGAMNLGAILGKRPGLIGGAVLVAGVYDLQALSQTRGRAQYGIEALQYVSVIPRGVRVILIHGDQDGEVPMSQSFAFETRAKASGVAAKLVLVEGVGHNFNGQLSGPAVDALGRLVD